MEINVNDYVRTKRGQIHKITDLKGYYENDKLIEDRQYVYIDNHFSGWDLGQFKELIIKSSLRIIDLIEVGDYVNGERVIALEKDVDKRNIYPSNVGAKIFTDYELQGNWYFGIQEEDIKSVLTKEMFEKMEYKVGE